MYQDSVLPDQLPFPDKNKKSTDVCCVFLGAIFAITLFVLACILFRQANVSQSLSKQLDSQNNICPKVIVFAKDTDQNGICNDQCPANSDTVAWNGVCLPNDPALRAKYLANPAITDQWDNLQTEYTLLFTALIAIGVGLLWMTFVHCLPRHSTIAAMVLAIILLFTIGILVLVGPSKYFQNHIGDKILVAVVCFLLVSILVAMTCLYSNQLRFQSIMLDYSRRFLQEAPVNYLYIPVYLVCLVGLIALFLFQYCAFTNNTYDNFFRFGQAGLLGWLNILQFFWGLQFLRDAFAFCVGGNAAIWYWTRQTSCYNSFRRLYSKNWGSVVGGSFLNAFFEVPTLLAELIICHPNTCCAKCGTCCANTCSCFGSFFNLVRTDSYSYINLTGIAFCESSRQCQKLCQQSNQFVGSHSAMKHYRFAAHVAMVCLIVIMGFAILQYRVMHSECWSVTWLIVIAYAFVTPFIDINADSAQGIQTSFLAENFGCAGYPYMQKCIPSLRRDLANQAQRKVGDGNC